MRDRAVVLAVHAHLERRGVITRPGRLRNGLGILPNLLSRMGWTRVVRKRVDWVPLARVGLGLVVLCVVKHARERRGCHASVGSPMISVEARGSSGIGRILVLGVARGGWV